LDLEEKGFIAKTMAKIKRFIDGGKVLPYPPSVTQSEKKQTLSEKYFSRHQHAHTRKGDNKNKMKTNKFSPLTFITNLGNTVVSVFQKPKWRIPSL
jgi:hypothetical protein